MAGDGSFEEEDFGKLKYGILSREDSVREFFWILQVQARAQ